MNKIYIKHFITYAKKAGEVIKIINSDTHNNTRIAVKGSFWGQWLYFEIEDLMRFWAF